MTRALALLLALALLAGGTEAFGAFGTEGSTKAQLTVGTASPTAITNIRVYSQSVTPAATPAAIGTTAQTFTVTGLTTADKIYINVPGVTSLCPMVHAKVSATDTLQLWFTTLTAVACTPASGTHTIMAIRS